MSRVPSLTKLSHRCVSAGFSVNSKDSARFKTVFLTESCELTCQQGEVRI